jgi:hypothetical protein
MLHYLKPSHHGFQVRRGQERFVDIEFHHRELLAYACEAYSRVVPQGARKSRIAFAEVMLDDASSHFHGRNSKRSPLWSSTPLGHETAGESSGKQP